MRKNINKNNPDELKHFEKNLMFNTVIKTVFFTLWIFVGFASFFMLTISAVAPKFAISICDYLDCKQTSYTIYQRIYERQKSDESLYNVLQMSVNMKDYEKVEKYARIMLEDDNFVHFSKKIDEATRENLDKQYSVYVDSYYSYVKKCFVIALYNNDKKNEAKMIAIDSVYDNAEELYVYVQLIMEDINLTTDQKNTELKSLYDRYGVKSSLLLKQAELYPSEDIDNYQKIIAYNKKIKIAEIQFYIYSAGGELVAKEAAQNNITNWTLIVENLMTTLI